LLQRREKILFSTDSATENNRQTCKFGKGENVR